MDVPVEIKGSEKHSAFYFNVKPKTTTVDSLYPAAINPHHDGMPAHDESPQSHGKQGVADEAEEGEDDEMERKKMLRTEMTMTMTRQKAMIMVALGMTAPKTFPQTLKVLRAMWSPRATVTARKESTPQRFLSRTSSGSPFCQSSNSDNVAKALRQFIDYQSNLFKYQHCTFCYSIYVCFDMACLLYFDHAGAYVSEPFSWVQPTSVLHKFVWSRNCKTNIFTAH